MTQSLSFAERVALAVADLDLPGNSLPSQEAMANIKQNVRDAMLDETYAMLRNLGATQPQINHPRVRSKR